MELTVANLISPMLAKAVDGVPEPDSVAGGLSYEPKWDGFRAIVYFDGNDTEIGSRGSKMLTRYFPELTDAFARLLPAPCVLDGEIVVRTGEPGGERLDWEALTQRIHPADSRVRRLAEETPAMFVAFDLLGVGDDEPPRHGRSPAARGTRGTRRRVAGPIYLAQTTTDVDLARRWLVEFEGAGLDGVVAKPLAAPYSPGKRAMLKVKHKRTADVVLLGYRVHTSGQRCRLAAARAVRQRRRAAECRRGIRLQRHAAPGTGRRARAAGDSGTRTALPSPGDRPQPVLLRQGRLLRAAGAHPGARGALRPDGGGAVPAHRAVRPLAARPGCRLVHVRAAGGADRVRPERGAPLALGC